MTPEEIEHHLKRYVEITQLCREMILNRGKPYLRYDIAKILVEEGIISRQEILRDEILRKYVTLPPEK